MAGRMSVGSKNASALFNGGESHAWMEPSSQMTDSSHALASMSALISVSIQRSRLLFCSGVVKDGFILKACHSFHGNNKGAAWFHRDALLRRIDRCVC